MDKFFDQAARILASEIPRRQALVRLGGVVLAMLGAKVALAAPCTTAGGKPGNNAACPGPAPQPAPFCVTGDKCPCGTKKCDPTKEQCCLGNGVPFCAPQNTTCCGNTTCKSGEFCGCPNANGVGTKCCKSNQACVNGKCVASKS